MKQVYIETLGCAKNRVDSEIMLASLQRRGYDLTQDPENAEVIVVNTCAFLSAASEESVDRILELSDYKANANCEKLVAAGCLSERYREGLLDEIPELDGILGSSDFDQIPQLVDQMYSEFQPQVFLNKKPHYKQYDNQERLQSTPQHFAYLKISEGCSNMCSFCNIPSLRGLISSRSIASIVDEVKFLVEQGVKEINVISQDTASYGRDLKDGTNLAKLIRSISEVEGDFWVRLFYVYPNTFTEEVAEAMASDPRICRYLDMPFQHISSSVLKKMNRKITQEMILEKLDMMKSFLPDLALRTTFIVGFPTETEEDFQQLYDFTKTGIFEHIGVFNYSHEDNIQSAKYGDPVPNAVKRERRERLMQLQQRVSQRRNQKYVGQTLKVLVEGPVEETELLLQGRSQYQGPEVDGVVYINEGQCEQGAFHHVEITDAHAYDLVGKIVG